MNKNLSDPSLLTLDTTSNSILNLIEQLLKHWKIIFISTLVTTVISILFTFNIKIYFEEDFEVEKISKSEEINYLILNQRYVPFEEFDSYITIDNEDNYLQFNINAESIISEMFRIMNERDILIEEINNSNILDKESLSEEEFRLRLKYFAQNNFEFNVIDDEDKLHYSITLKGKLDDRDTLLKILKKTWSVAKLELNQLYKAKFKMMTDNYEIIKNIYQEDLEERIELAMNELLFIKENRLTFLKEQLLIAEGLQIKENLYLNNQINSELNVITDENKKLKDFITTKFSYYLKGSDSIKKEIEILEMSNEKLIFDEKLLNLKVKLLKIKSDKYIDNITDIFNQSPIINEKLNFTPGKINYASNIKIESLKSLVIIIGLLFGLITSIFYILLRDIYLSYKKSKY
tara:strand:- start:369 stop:1580 length:1212 start_codon:yes stop_codon:yes gene_type:complete